VLGCVLLLLIADYWVFVLCSLIAVFTECATSCLRPTGHGMQGTLCTYLLVDSCVALTLSCE
jgi:hypothetical protein